MKSATYLLLFILFLSTTLPAQQLYMPRDVKQAFNKGTRSPDGRPGPRYWQNKASYNIDITALPPDRTIRGKEEIVYTNSSPDSLRNLVLKLFLNIHKPGAPRTGGASDDYLTSGVHIDGFSINGKSYPWHESSRYFTWQPVRLPEALLPGQSVNLHFDWHYEISLKSNREGMIDSTTYFLAYFYPRIAVYDDYNGWDVMDFTDQQEFYSDFNDYSVKITVPANYLVWGTGNLSNPDEVLQPEIANRYKTSLLSDQTVNVASLAELKAKKVTRDKNSLTWHFEALDIPDVAFGLSDHFVWDAASVVVDDKTGRRASVQAAYNDTASDYRQMVQYAHHALHWFSHHWPGVPYPFEKSTVFQGYADMEYPMMVNDEAYDDTLFSRFVVEHEIAHTYFPFYMGINESRYGFMDEGWATTFEYLIGIEDLGRERADAFFQQFRVASWIQDPSMLEDLPIITPADVLKNVSYGNNAYGKPALGYLALKDLLGDEQFQQCLHAYMERWHGKHPLPWDFFNSFNDVSKQNLNWFWNAWFFSNNYIDLSVKAVLPSTVGYNIILQNIGGMPAPANLIIRFTDGSSQTVHLTPAIWQADPKMAKLPVKESKKIKSVRLNGGIWMDADESNNYYELP